MVEQVNEKNDANVYLITGTDGWRIQRTAQDVVQEKAGENPDPFLFERIREQEGKEPEETLKQVIAAIMSPGFGGRKTVFLENFSYFPQAGTERGGKNLKEVLDRLAECIKAGIPSDICLIMSGTNIDQRSKLVKACRKGGEVIVWEKPDVWKPGKWQPQVMEIVHQTAAKKGVRLPQEVAEYLTGVVGTDSGRIDSELEKLVCYCDGGDESVTLAAAQEVCQGQAEAISWSFLDAMGQCRKQEALRLLGVLFQQRQNETQSVARSLVLQLAQRWRELLQVRIYMSRKRLKTPKAVQAAVQNQAEDEKQQWLDIGFQFVKAHPYRAQILAGQALHFSGSALARGMIALRDADAKCVSTNIPRRLVVEQLVFTLLGYMQK